MDLSTPGGGGVSGSTDDESKEHDGRSSPQPTSQSLVHVCCNGKVKLLPWSALPGPLSIDEAQAAVHAHSAAALAAPAYSHKVVAHTHHARLVAFVLDAKSRILYTLGNDAKVKVFALDAQAARRAGMSEREVAAAAGGGGSGSGGNSGPSPGILLRKFRKVQGTFRLGYPYILKKIADDLLFYTADEGIFLLRL